MNKDVKKEEGDEVAKQYWKEIRDLAEEKLRKLSEKGGEKGGD